MYQKAAAWPEAAAAFRRAVAQNPMDGRAQANLASASLRTGDVETARTAFTAMVSLGHQVAPAQFNLGVLAQRAGDKVEAGRRYRLAIAADPGFKPALDALAAINR